MRQRIDTRIDPDLCIGCGQCVPVCPSYAIEMRDDQAVVTGEWSIGCGHCAAACPVDAITVGRVDRDALKLETIGSDDTYLPPGEFDAASLIRLMRSRRSCRNYTDRPVPREVLSDLVKIGTLAPSGTNSQMWTFTLLADRQAVVELGEAVAAFFRQLNRRARSRFLRLLARVFMQDALGAYYRDYHDTVEEGLRQWDQEGKDRLFHGAPAVILVGARPGAACPKEDALLASQNILLAAHATGLGTCLVGFVVEALKHDAGIKRIIGVPATENIYSVIAVGYPDEIYHHPGGRSRIHPRWILSADT